MRCAMLLGLTPQSYIDADFANLGRSASIHR
jgi:hypothetical protein